MLPFKNDGDEIRLISMKNIYDVVVREKKQERKFQVQHNSSHV